MKPPKNPQWKTCVLSANNKKKPTEPLETGGGWEQLETLPSPPCHQLPAAQLNLWTGKGSSLQKLLQDPLLLASENISLAIGQDRHWNRVTSCSWQQRWEKGAVTGAGGPGRLRVVLFGFHLDQEVLKKTGTASPEREKNETKRSQVETTQVVLSRQQLSTRGLPAPAGSPHLGLPRARPRLPRNRP
ncbi:hypothetical protein EK904_006387 [Melospiza melodia maxima]|nr:hypothetical protein EK904_006387 [Melospiza melodia maxima]